MVLFWEWLASILLVIGGFFVLVGAVGMVKLPDFYTRLHAPTKATTLGIGCILLASMDMHALRGEGVGVQEFAIVLFLFITAPVSAYMIAKAALHRRVPMRPGSYNPKLLHDARERHAPIHHCDQEKRPS